MSFPASVTTISVHGRVLTPAGNAATGAIYFKIPQALRDTTGNVVVGPSDISATLDASGDFTVSLVATDDPDITPQGWAYIVRADFDVWRQTFEIQVPYNGGSLEFADILPAVTTPSVSTYLPISGGTLTGSLGIGTAPAHRLHVVGTGTTRTVFAEHATTGSLLANFHSRTPDVGSRAFAADISGDASSRFIIESNGLTEWGNGSSRDTNLYRSAANVLKTDDSFHVSLDLRHLGTSLGFYNAAAVAKPTVTGSRAGNAALASLLTALANLGLITDSSTV